MKSVEDGKTYCVMSSHLSPGGEGASEGPGTSSIQSHLYSAHRPTQGPDTEDGQSLFVGPQI